MAVFLIFFMENNGNFFWMAVVYLCKIINLAKI